jgi:hypothetical protein
LVAGGWWLVAGGWWQVAGTALRRREEVKGHDKQRASSKPQRTQDSKEAADRKIVRKSVTTPPVRVVKTNRKWVIRIISLSNVVDGLRCLLIMWENKQTECGDCDCQVCSFSSLSLYASVYTVSLYLALL